MSELRSALDALGPVLGGELHGLDDGTVLDELRSLARAVNQLDAELVRLFRHAELTQAAEHDGLKSMRSWSVGHLHWTGGQADRVRRAGRVAQSFPAVAAGFAEGSITAAQVDVVAQAAGAKELAAAAEQGIDLEPFDQLWAVVTEDMPHDKLAVAVQSFSAALDPDGREPDPTEGRRLTMTTHSDGSVTGRFVLDALGGERVKTGIESVAQADRPLGDLRDRAQQNADALVQVFDNQLAAGSLPTMRGHKPQVVVSVELEDLVAAGDGSGNGAGGGPVGHGLATTGFGTVISAARARMLACDGQVSRIVFGADGTPLDHGRTVRIVPPKLRRAVEQRDKHCVFTGCGAPTFWCDVHHLVHWVDDGDTSLENSALLCERHHTKVHHGFVVRRDRDRPPGEQWRTWRPDGTEIIIGPRIE